MVRAVDCSVTVVARPVIPSQDGASVLQGRLDTAVRKVR